jgi:hypothetical protein
MDHNRVHARRRLSGAGLALGLIAAVVVTLPTAAAAVTAPPFATTWVSNTAGNSVTELSPTGTVVGTPISGASTGLDQPTGVAAGSDGDVFVANAGADSITEYAPGASGDVAPITTIAGAQTGLASPSGVAISGSSLWVTDATTNTVEEFTVGADGNVLPIRAIYGSRTRLDNPVSVFLGGQLDASLWVVNDPAQGSASVEELDPFDAGNERPVIRIAGARTGLSDPRAVVDVIGKSIVGRIAVANAGSNTITEYLDFPVGSGADLAPVASISGAATTLDQPAALGLDAVGHLSVANAGSGDLLTFTRGAHGDQAPTRSVSDLSDPGGAAVLAATPGIPTAVSGTAANHAVHVRWSAPNNTGGGILGYSVLTEDEKPGGEVVAFESHTFDTTHTHITERHLKNGHRYFFLVSAVNEIGASPFSRLAQASPATVPRAPRAVTVTPHSHALAVTWKAPTSDGGRKIGHYTVVFTRCSSKGKNCHVASRTVKGSRTSVTLKGLTPGTTYRLLVRARNSRGLGKPSKIVKATPTA